MLVDEVSPESKRIPVRQLDLDPENPRLIVAESPSQLQLLHQLYETESLDELVHSLLENGYFAEEPLVVVPNGRRYTVVEGNRRLATLQLIHQPELRRSIRAAGWPTATRTQLARLRSIPCIVYPDRKAVLPFLGFRHITGAKKWAPYQKARFVSQMLASDVSLARIQEILGDESQTLKKLYQQFVIYEQLVSQLDFSPEILRGRFSLLEVMLGQRPIKGHIGLPHRLPTTAVDKLVDDDHLDALHEVAAWVFGTNSLSPVITDSRQIAEKLAKVIGDGAALESLRESGDLDSAMERLGGEEKYLQRRIGVAERALRDVISLAPLYLDAPMVGVALTRLVKLGTNLERTVSPRIGHSGAAPVARE